MQYGLSFSTVVTGPRKISPLINRGGLIIKEYLEAIKQAQLDSLPIFTCSKVSNFVKLFTVEMVLPFHSFRPDIIGSLFFSCQTFYSYS